jgi:hypothetical protein
VNWLTPLTGVLLAAAVIPPLILLYFLKLRRKSHPIASTLLWQTSVEDLHANAPFQRLRWSLLLLLQLIVLLLLVLSVMQPRIQFSGQRGGKTVIMIDNSASMTATDVEDDATRLDQAKRRARETVEKLYSGGWLSQSPGETMVIAFSDRAEILSRFTDSKPALLNAIDSVQPTHGETKLEEALKLARAYTTNTVDPNTGELRPIDDPPAIELFSDGAIADLDDQVLRGEELIFNAIGTPEAANVAITAISVDRPFDQPTFVEVFVSLANYNESDVNCDIQLSVNGTALGIQGTHIDAAERSPVDQKLSPGRANVVFSPFEQPRGAILEVANLTDDELDADNVATLIVPPPRQLSVALVNQQSQLLLWVLEGLSLKSIEKMTPAQFDSLVQAGGATNYDVVVLDNYAPPSLPEGRYLVFGKTPPVEGLNEFGEGANQVILTTQDDHPCMRYVAMDNVFISRFRQLAPADDVQVIAEGSSGPAIVEISRGPLALLYVTFDPLESSWPFQRSFVTFIFNAIDYLGHRGEQVTSQGYRPGDAITTRLPESARNMTMTLPDRSVAEVTASDPSEVIWGPATLSGVHLLKWTDPASAEPQERPFAVNLLSETEGALAVPSEIKVGGSKEIRSAGEGATSYTPLWPWAVGIALVILLLEWWIYHKRLLF